MKHLSAMTAQLPILLVVLAVSATVCVASIEAGAHSLSSRSAHPSFPPTRHGRYDELQAHLKNDDVGESAAEGRRAAGMTGCFASDGGCSSSFSFAGGSNRAGNDEALLSEGLTSNVIDHAQLSEKSKVASDSKEALCDASGGKLPCEKFKIYKSCPDDLTAGRFFFVSGGTGKANCSDFSATPAIESIAISNVDAFAPVTPKYIVVTKAGLIHPHKASKSVGAIFLKRSVCTAKGNTVCKTYKIGLCVKCPGKKGNFKSDKATKAWGTDKQKVASEFIKHCLAPALKSYKSNKKIMPDKYKCDAENMKWFKISEYAF